MNICKVESCNLFVHGNGYCSKHYTQIREHGKLIFRTIYDANDFEEKLDYFEMILRGKYCDKIAIVKIDKEDFSRVKEHKWGLKKNKNINYCESRINGKLVKLHRFILGEMKGKVVDHINHDGLDNRKNNLRYCTHSENMRNRKSIGIYFSKIHQRWVSAIRVNYKVISLGVFKNREDALKARQQGELKYFGEFAYKNNENIS